jgi:hypothetical protein
MDRLSAKHDGSGGLPITNRKAIGDNTRAGLHHGPDARFKLAVDAGRHIEREDRRFTEIDLEGVTSKESHAIGEAHRAGVVETIGDPSVAWAHRR